MGSTYKLPNIYDGFSPAKQKVWDYLADQAPYEGEFEVNQSRLAETLGYSRATIQHALKTFISANLLTKARERTGRGNGSLFRFLWSFIPESETPSRITTLFDSPPRCIAKDSPTYRYYAAELRRICEKSDQLEKQQRGVVGKLLQLLQGKEKRLWEKAKIFFQRKINEGLDLPGFFVWLEKYLKPEIRSHEDVNEIQQAIHEAKERKKNELENQTGEPPKRKNFSSWEEYSEAYETYLQNTE